MGKKIIVDFNAHIINIECIVKKDNNSTYALISFENLGFGTITAVKFSAKGYNSFDELTQINRKDTFILIIQDLNVPPNTLVNNLKAIMPNNDIKKLELEECQICYSDGLITTYNGKNYKEFVVEEYNNSAQLDALNEKFHVAIKYHPEELDVGWICGCGRFNMKENEICSFCENYKINIFEINNQDELSKIYEEYQKNKEQQRELDEQKHIKEMKDKKRIKILIFSFTAIFLVAIIITILVGAISSAEGKSSKSYTTSNNSYSSGSTYESASSVLKFTKIKITTNSSYTVCTGTITNTGSKTYKFVEIKGAFKNSAGDIVDTDWTYAVGSEGLAPGESSTFRMSVPKDYTIKDCSISIIDYN